MLRLHFKKYRPAVYPDGGRGSVVGISTSLWAWRFGIRNLAGARGLLWSTFLQTDPWAHSASCAVGTRSLPQVKAAQVFFLPCCVINSLILFAVICPRRLICLLFYLVFTPRSRPSSYFFIDCDSCHRWNTRRRCFSLIRQDSANCCVSGDWSLSRSGRAKNTRQVKKTNSRPTTGNQDLNHSRQLPHIHWQGRTYCISAVGLQVNHAMLVAISYSEVK